MYYIYHIKGKKWGCTKNLKRRLKEQGFIKADEVRLEEDIDKASDLEKKLNIDYGYDWNDSQDYRVIAKARNSITKEGIQRGADKLKKLYAEGKVKINRETVKSDAYRKKMSRLMKGVLQSEEIRKKISDNNPRRIFSDDDIRFIRNNFFQVYSQWESVPKGKYTTGQLAKMFNTCRRSITRIVKREKYKFVI